MILILAATSGSQQGSPLTLLLPLVLIVGLYFLMIRPQRQKQKQQQVMQTSLQVGDDVLISGGIYGTLIEIDEATGVVEVEIAPGTQIRMLRQGVLQRLVEPGDEGYLDDEPERSDEETDDRP